LFTYYGNKRISRLIINWKRKISCYYFSFLERLSMNINYFYLLLYKWRKNVILNEIKMANLSTEDKILHIGCGIFPTGAIVIAREKNVTVTGIDNNYRYIKLARKIVDRNNLSDLIKIEYGNGINYHIKDFNVIYISINVYPIDSVLENLSIHAKKNTKVIYKTYKNDIDIFSEKLELENKFSVEFIQQNPRTQSILLIKK